jgi:hypothetical protein
MRIVRKQCDQKQQRGRSEDDAEYIVQGVRLRFRCVFACHPAHSNAADSQFKAKVAPAKKFSFFGTFRRVGPLRGVNAKFQFKITKKLD